MRGIVADLHKIYRAYPAGQQARSVVRRYRAQESERRVAIIALSV